MQRDGFSRTEATHLPKQGAQTVQRSGTRGSLKRGRVIAECMARFRFPARPLLLLLLCTAALAQQAPKDSLSNIKDGSATLTPVATIAEPRLDKPAGLAHWQGAWWALNADGTLLRAATPDFKDAQSFLLPGVTLHRPEALTVLGDDLLVCDTGNPRLSDAPRLAYRAKYEQGKLSLAARYTLAPAKPFDAEAAFTLDGKLHFVTRNRGEAGTFIYRFNELAADKPNVPELAATTTLDANAVITAADCDGKNVVLIGQTHIYRLGISDLTAAPAAVRYHADLCKAAALHDGRLVMLDRANVYALATLDIKQALPALPAIELPLEQGKYEPDGTGEAWKGGAFALPLRNIGEKEHLRWMIAGGHLLLAGRLRYEGAFTSSSEQGSRLGTGLVLMFGTGDDDHLTGQERIFWLGDNGLTGLDAWKLEPNGMKLSPLADIKVAGEVKESWMNFEYALPLTAVFGEGKMPDTFRVNAWGFNLRRAEPRLAGANFGSINHPYTWAHCRVVVR